jgi:hypothetical protein
MDSSELLFFTKFLLLDQASLSSLSVADDVAALVASEVAGG